MAKKDQKKARTFQETLVVTLEKFDLKAFKKWVEKYNKPLWKQLCKQNEECQMMTLCKCICNRTDMLNTEAHKKAVLWLKEHNTKGRMF